MELQELMSKFQEYLEHSKELKTKVEIKQEHLTMDYKDFIAFDLDLANELIENPEDTLKAFEVTLVRMRDEEQPKLKVRFKNLDEFETSKIRIRDIRVKHYGKFYVVTGVIRHISEIYGEVLSRKFECPNCGNILNVMQKRFEDKKEPRMCGCGRKGKFTELGEEKIDSQKMVIEEEFDTLEGNQQPNKIDILIQHSLTSKRLEKFNTLGARVSVTGILLSRPKLIKGRVSNELDRYMEANYIRALDEKYMEIEISQKDVKMIKEYSKRKDFLDICVNSFATHIAGYEEVKKAIILQLYGGVNSIDSKSKKKNRGDFHILLCGDPSTGKTQLSMAIQPIALKYRYTSGARSSKAGLTVTLIKDEFINAWGLEAGALILANKGTCVMDEFDKMTEQDREALHEQMESQQITIDKANIHTCYSNDTEVLTIDGWKGHSEINIDKDKIAQYNPTNQSIEFVKPISKTLTLFKGTMYHFKSKSVDILVTPNHNLWVRKYCRGEYNLIQAQNLEYHRFNFINAPTNHMGKTPQYHSLNPINYTQKRTTKKYLINQKLHKIPMNLWLQLGGYYLSEGGINTTNNTISITQKTRSKYEIKIEKCLKDFCDLTGYKLTKTPLSNGRSTKDYSRFQITSKQLRNSIEKLFGMNQDKHIPSHYFLFNKQDLTILFQSYMEGDGTKGNNRDWVGNYCKPLKLANDIQTLSFLIGKSTHLTKTPKGHYRISMTNRIEQGLRINKNLKKEEYDGEVFCFTVPSQILVTRRNGCIGIQGNTLQAQTSILACANWKDSRFNPNTDVYSQIDMPDSIISRFDLYFAFIDRAGNEEIDTKVIRHVLRARASHLYEEDKKEEEIVPYDFWKKHIIYAKQFNPKTTKEIADKIVAYYVKLRSRVKGQTQITIPITARQGEAIQRLSEASARMHLRDVSEEDVSTAISLIEYSLHNVAFDSGQVDIDIIETGMSTKKRNLIYEIRAKIKELGANYNNGQVPIDELVNSFDKGLHIELEELLEKEKRAGNIFEPRRGFIKEL